MNKSIPFLKLKTCFKCPYHLIKDDGEERTSYCKKEACFSVYTKCIANQALERFLSQEIVEIA
jgi:hypothetical protein